MRSVLVLLASFSFALKLSQSFLVPGRILQRRSISMASPSRNEPSPISDSTNPQQVSMNLTVGWQQIKPFLRIAVPFFKEDKEARYSLISVVALALLKSGVSVMFSYISRDFFNSLSARDEALFYQKIELFFVVLVVAVPISVYYRFVREKLSLYWREALTSRVLDQYYANRTYFVLETMREVDNPDQRISADIKRFTKTSLDFFITILTSIIDLLSFSAILFQIYPGLFAAIIACALAGSIATTSLGKRLASLNFQRLKSEADFRFGLLRTRENAEGMAFYDATAKEERSTVSGLFSSVVEAVLAQVVAQRDLEYFTTSYAFMVQVLPNLIVAPLYFAHKVELGAVSQSYSAFNHVLSDFSIIINEFEAISAFSASLTRLSAFFEKLEQVGWVSKAETEGNATTTPSTIVMERRTTMENGDAEMVLQCSNLTIITPDRKRTILGGGSDGENSSAFIAEGIDLTVRGRETEC